MSDESTPSVLKIVICSRRGGHEHTPEHSIRALYDACDPQERLVIDEGVAYYKENGHLRAPESDDDVAKVTEPAEVAETPAGDSEVPA